jgi:STE24 endopeptidase
MGIGWVLVAVVGLVVLGCFARFPRWGWAGAGALVAVLSGLYALFAPLVIDPLFNRIEPMEASSLRDAVLETARRGGVEAETVWVADASRRTRAVNAYVTGFGATRRIVLYDTLVDTLPAEEVLLVVAHEAGHWRRHHLYKGLGLGVGAAMIGLFLAQGVLARWRGGRPAGHPFLVLPAYALYVTAVFVTLPVANTVSRAFEIEADRAALELTGDASTLISGKVRIAIENLSFVNPPRWVEIALYTHPCTARRIAMAEAGP